MQTKTKTPQEEYKQTELGLLPKEWEVVRLGDILIPDRQKIKWQEYDGKIPIVEKIAFDTGKIIFRKKKKSRTDLYIANKNHLLTSKINFHQGAVAITNCLTAATTHYEFYKISEKADIFYLWLYFRTKEFKEIFAQEIKFRGFKKEANFKFIKDFKIPLPPLQEQKAIAFVLSTIQTAKEKTEQVIQATKELKKSLMKHLFTYGPVSLKDAEKVKLKETEIGKIPEGWEVVRLGDVVKTFSGGTPDRRKPNYWGGNIPWAKSGELNDHRIYKVEESISEVGFKNSSAKYVEKDTLLIAMYGATAGKVGLAKFKFTINQAICAILPNNRFLSEFYFYYLIFIREKLLSQRFGGAQPNLNQQIIKNLKISLPPLQTQKKIASILSAVDEKIEKEENKKKALEGLFKSMLYNLMSAKIRVKDLVVENE